ncbi:MAG: hypothetical protein DWQ36_09785 [Acidobacteria bacterium]|nr:MAG: hypothetical protein DWQ30_01065 [Acidobacteriota bacterium]REK08351.1 MAG: hypothetical protein DWQ36_09785 [Acidobacteriota bacterium]
MRLGGPRLGLALGLAPVLALAAATASPAQFVQYARSGGVSFPLIPDQEAFDEAMDGALWRGGRWFADPWIGIRSIGYSEGFTLDQGDGEGQRGDTGVQASGGAGLRIYRPIGGRGTWATHVLPEYTWFERGDRSRFNGRFGTGVFANLGGLLLQATATRQDELEFFSRQIEDQISQRRDELSLAAELGLFGALSLHLQGAVREIESLEDGESFDFLRQLDREETSITAGFRLRSSDGLMFGFGAGVVQTDIVPSATLGLGVDRSSDGSLIYGELSRPSDSFDLRANAQLLRLDFDAGPTPLELDEVTGQLGLSRRLGGRFALDAYYRRTAGLGLGADLAYFLDSSVGLGASTPLGSVGALRAFVETGNNDYRNFLADSAEREDDYTAYGVALNLRHRTGVGVYLEGRETDYDSNLPGFDRKVTTVRGGLNLGLSLTLRRSLVFGDDGSPWV